MKRIAPMVVSAVLAGCGPSSLEGLSARLELTELFVILHTCELPASTRVLINGVELTAKQLPRTVKQKDPYNPFATTQSCQGGLWDVPQSELGKPLHLEVTDGTTTWVADYSEIFTALTARWRSPANRIVHPNEETTIEVEPWSFVTGMTRGGFELVDAQTSTLTSCTATASVDGFLTCPARPPNDVTPQSANPGTGRGRLSLYFDATATRCDGFSFCDDAHRLAVLDLGELSWEP